MSCDVQTLLDEARCFAALPPGTLNLIKLAMLCRIVNGSGPTCTDQEAAGTPIGSATPDFIGQLYEDTVSGIFYKATGLTSADWVASAGGGGCDYQDMQVAWTPGGAQLGSLFQFKTTFSVYSPPGIDTVSFLAATSAFGFDIENWQSITAISFPNLVNITDVANGYFAVQDCPLLVSFSAPLFQNAGNGLTIYNLPITTLSLPALTTVAGSTYLSGCAGLTSISVPSLLPVNGFNVNCDGNALNQASVDHILARCVASAGYISGTVNLGGGTNSAPSAAGLIDVGILTVRGVTVTVNP